MENYETKPWISKLNVLSINYIMPAISILFILFNTVVNLWVDGKLETVLNVLAIFVLVIFACNLLSSSKSDIMKWCRENILIILYFMVRIVSLWQSGFDYSVLRTIFFEAFFLVGICTVTVDKRGNNYFYIRVFIFIELVLSMGSLIIYSAIPYMNSSMMGLLESLTLYGEGNIQKAILFGNTNTAGIMAGFSIVLSVVCWDKGIVKNWILVGYGVFNIIALALFGCRSSDIGVLAVVCIMLLLKIAPRIKRELIVIIALLVVSASVIPLYIFMESQGNLDYKEFTPIEHSINDMSTGRYVIWKGCYLTQKDDMLFGKGSLKMEQLDRKELINNMDPDYYWRQAMSAELGPHNGYIGMISGTGILGLLLFIGILIQRIKRSPSIKSGNWYLLLIFIFVINAFESLFVLNKYFTCFYMMMLFIVDFNDYRVETNNVDEV